GDVIEPDDAVAAIGSGGPYALAAARALLAHSNLEAAEMAREAMKIAASICLYTNEQIIIHQIGEKS
ncbi:MAG: HslU--HslV peptidase proteolytic subunit, partial [Desulfobacteraceae bacterium]